MPRKVNGQTALERAVKGARESQTWLRQHNRELRAEIRRNQNSIRAERMLELTKQAELDALLGRPWPLDDQRVAEVQRLKDAFLAAAAAQKGH